MTARDIIHDAVRGALVKDGWNITDDPYRIEHEGVRVYADLAAERLLAGERNGRRIVVEIKRFVGLSPVYDLEVAIGQYELYRAFLELAAPEREVYLAVSGAAVRYVLQRLRIALLVVDVPKQEVVSWTS